MADKCVVCGESDEGKPLYKKLGSGEHNVEVITALKILELTSLPDSAKNDHYICWDCDETIVAEYGRFLESEEKHQIKLDEEKAKRKRKRAKLRVKKKQEEKHLVEKIRTGKAERRKSNRVMKPKNNIIRITANTTNGTHSVSKTKKTDIDKAKNAYNMNHCLLCDNTFDSSVRGYQRFPLNKIVTEEMDIASVIEQLGLARHIAPEMKSKRFACSNCFYTIRRNYKDKIQKGSSLGETPVESKNMAQKGSFHRATPDEHAAEIAKLLPPALAECYKIMTSESFDNKDGEDKKGKETVENAVDQKAEGDIEEDEEGLCVSQDELGNYVVNMNLRSPPKTPANSSEASSNGKDSAAESPCTPRKKKNILLPKRHHHHLVDSSASPTGVIKPLQNSDGTPIRSGAAAGEADDSRTCNICGHTVVGKPADWWHTLSSPLSAFETITVSMALQLLETSLASTSGKGHLASQVCLPCYGMVSTGFRLQIVQRIARQKNIDPSKVNLSKVKFHMMKKDDKLLTNKKDDSILDEEHASNKENKVAENAVIETKDMDGPNSVVKNKNVNEISTKSGGKRVRRNSDGNEEKKVKKMKLIDIIKSSSVERNKGDRRVSNSRRKSFSSEMDSDAAFNDSLHEESDGGDQSPADDGSYLLSSDSDFEIRPRKHKMNKKTKRRRQSRQTPVKASKNAVPEIRPVKASKNAVPESSPLKTSKNAVPEIKPDKDVSVGKNVPVYNTANQKDDPEKQSIPDVNGNSCSNDVENKKQPALYEVLPSCTLYFAISKMKPARVMLRDIGEILPKETFNGQTLNVRLTANSTYQISLCDDSTTPLQYILNSLATPNHLVNSCTWTKEDDPEADTLINGRCVVCASQCNEKKFFWHKLEEDINPPSIQVPVRWVCASLSIAPVAVSDSDRAKGLVCRICFVNLSSEFNVFVRTKIGESCDIPPSEVEINDYIVTFNQDTMNIEADPADASPEEEIEESEKILSKIMPVIYSIGLDNLVGDFNRVPLDMNEYTIWLLLVLNEFRVQLGRDSTYLVDLLNRLMPIELQSEGLCPSEDKLLPFIRFISEEWTLESKDSFEKLKAQIPLDLFESREASVFSNPSHLAMAIKKEVPSLGLHHEIALSNKQENGVQWEDFLLPVDLDRLLKGTAKPIPREDFNNGLLYAFWRLQHIIGGDVNQLAEWIKQVSPITLDENHLQLLLDAPEPVHEHLQIHPEDVDKLKCVIIPEFVKIKPKAFQNKVKPANRKYKKREKVPANASTIEESDHSTIKSADQTPADKRKIGRARKKRPVQSTASEASGSPREDPSEINTETPVKSQVDDSQENKINNAMELEHSDTLPNAEFLGFFKKVMQKSPATDTSCPKQTTLMVQGSKASQFYRSPTEINTAKCITNSVNKDNSPKISIGLTTPSQPYPYIFGLKKPMKNENSPTISVGIMKPIKKDNSPKISIGLTKPSKKEVNCVLGSKDDPIRKKRVSSDKGVFQGKKDNAFQKKIDLANAGEFEGKKNDSIKHKNVPTTETECQDEAASLANKVKELERQLLAMKKENETLLQINQKLSETVSSDELEETKIVEVEKPVKTNEIKLVKADKNSHQNVPAIAKYSMDDLKEILQEPENSKSLIKKKSCNKEHLQSNSVHPGHSKGKKNVVTTGQKREQVKVPSAKSTNNEKLNSPVQKSLDSSTSDSQNKSRMNAQGPQSKTTPLVLEKKLTNSIKSSETSSSKKLKTKQKQVKPKPRFEELLNYDT